MDNEFDYYLIFPSFKEGVPLLMNDDDYDSDGTSFLYQDEYAEDIKTPVHLKFNPPVPPQPRMVDNLSYDGFSVFSKKIYDILSPLNIKGLQLVPFVIIGNKNEEYDNYWAANIYNCFECFDKEKSIYEYSDFLECWENIEKLVLDKEILSKISLNDRLVFTSKETSQFIIYHKSIVNVIMSVNPEGVFFVPVESWSQGVQFKE